MTKQFLLALVLMACIHHAHTQSLNDELIQLGKFYKSFHFANAPSSEAAQLDGIKHPELQTVKKFIAEATRQNNKIAATPFLTRPDSLTLKHLFTIRSINWNLHNAEAKDNAEVIDSLNKFPASTYEQLAAYYGMLFTSVGNKNRPLNMSDANFTLNTYGLKDDTEKGILFLEGMDTFGMMIWGFMNVVKPPNFDRAMGVIEDYPMFNNQPYYQFQDLNFPDFKLTIDKRRAKESFKKYQLNKYLNTLLYHSYCLGQKKKTKKEQQQVMLGSIISTSLIINIRIIRMSSETYFKRESIKQESVNS
ncbi:hypothetical protein KK062_02355 [Fulvivirgaceae bacterium PWU5]|uniref:Uncharacterized protein n=1 Tax=Dawidia cretensis TaxID=2782350 RepID=A0AAP2DVJ9_9BACT|nr:hypothetical protein [Dawidia cretensis]MBT1707043.1 hypothetical protein [Dawidia cretensis]